ncbi:MAG: flagellar hook-length control protein FliK [Pseudomonadota bacterium]
MEELQLALTTARVDQRNFGLWINNWQIGQVLNALVSNQLPSGDLVLRVGGQQITATTDIPIQQGTNLMLEVKQLQPVPTLRVLNPVANASPASVGGTLQLLPSSGASLSSPPLGSVVQNVQVLASALTTLSPVLSESLGQLFRSAPRADRIATPQGLASAIQDSGLLFEAKVARAPGANSPAINSDLKASVFRALAHANGALSKAEAVSLPPADIEALMEMRRELESGLGRISVNQLASQSAPEAQSGTRVWQFDIPVQLASQFHNLAVRIEQENGSEGRAHSEVDAEEERWKVELALALPALGAVDLRINLVGNSVELRLAAERSEVREAMSSRLQELDRSLASRGLHLKAASSVELYRPKAQATETGLDVRA